MALKAIIKVIALTFECTIHSAETVYPQILSAVVPAPAVVTGDLKEGWASNVFHLKMKIARLCDLVQ